jgi:hypothetical protein
MLTEIKFKDKKQLEDLLEFIVLIMNRISKMGSMRM